MERQDNQTYVFVEEVMSTLSVSRPKAYKFIKAWNRELEAMDYTAISGRIPRKYFEKKIYGMAGTASSANK